jgi:hypothetical protein
MRLDNHPAQWSASNADRRRRGPGQGRTEAAEELARFIHDESRAL